MDSSVQISELMQQSNVKFGTSGARGLVSDMNDRVCYAYTLAFLEYMLQAGFTEPGKPVMIAGDCRASSARIMAAAARAAKDVGLNPVHCGKIPTPALALAALEHQCAGVMVTGSHIPDDRNGMKYYRPDGEVLKSDEQAIYQARITLPEHIFTADGSFAVAEVLPELDASASRAYIARYVDVFSADALSGLKIGVYQHSSVAREMMVELIEALGGEVVRLGYSEAFIPVDTEAIRQEDVDLARKWSLEFGLDSIISTDGDADRPLISDEKGEWLRGDVAGILCARFLAVEHVVTPVSSNSAVEKSQYFRQVMRTRIGSPYVIDAMNLLLQEGHLNVAGYEANGGFLIASDLMLNGKSMKALPTRDAIIVLLTILVQSRQSGQAISALLKALPQRFTFSDRIKNFPSADSQKMLAIFNSGHAEADVSAADLIFSELFGPAASIDSTDGARISLESGEVIHLRASGNAPELRCYNEAGSEERVRDMNAMCMKVLSDWKA